MKLQDARARVDVFYKVALSTCRITLRLRIASRDAPRAGPSITPQSRLSASLLIQPVVRVRKVLCGQ